MNGPLGSYSEVVFRLFSALLIGCIVGLDRNLHGKPTGMKTMGLVSLGASLVTMASMDFSLTHGGHSADAVSRTIQGVITGIGFLGAGVIVHDRNTEHIRGLTTAASIWVTAALGIVCGIGSWQIAAIAMGMVLLLFFVGRPLEKMLHTMWLSKSSEERDEISKGDE
ncbi:MgtC/SapB family protein [Janthinobacterium sp. CG_S6]|uniref:MgtC/SapB family protein n=1 Tax=unclassified Janthinobacterium TaxID=2610881 RepID=UPI00034BA889|nr:MULTISPECIES: MgtC/SapB family protein [unclassified Janthinobacterium]MEC5160719.1 putative Mg2+ transporter-C (MgtC) family protein [Janthinobacterium sp. CG_S6]